MKRGLRLLLILITAFGIAQSARGGCLTTLPPNPPFTPSAPYSTNAGQGFWYGTDALWVRLPISLDGTRKGVASKLFVWSRGFNWQSDPKPFLVVTGKRLDGDAPAIAIAGGVPAGSGDRVRMLIGVVFPTEGCWEVTAYHSGHSLTFVMWVDPYDPVPPGRPASLKF
jgi:hypothetical protein